MKIFDKCKGLGHIPETPCEGCHSGYASWRLVVDGHDFKTGKKKTHVEHEDCRDTCQRYQWYKEQRKEHSRNAKELLKIGRSKSNE